MNYYVLQHSASSLKPRLKFWKYNPTTKTVYFTATTKDGDRQYPIGISKLQDMNPGNIKQALMNSLAKFGVVHDDQLVKAVNEVLSMSHSEEMEIIDVSDDHLEHASRHEGYYSPNYTDKKATPYIYDTLVKSSDGRQIGMRFKGIGDREWVIIYVPSIDFTPTYNNIIKLINDNKDISNRKVVIRENEKAKAARIVTNFFNSPSVAGNEKMTTFVKNPQHLKRSSSVSHSLFTEVYDMDDYLEHHGILGMKWGVRRYQNPDGSLTAAGRRHYGRNYTIRELKKNIQSASTYEEKKAAVTANKVNRITKTNYRNASTLAATSLGGLTGAGTMAGLMYAGLMSVNPLLPIASLVGGIASGKAINAGRGFINHFRNVRVEMIDRALDKEHYENKSNKDERLNRAVGMLNDLDNHDIDGYKKKRSSFSGDLEKDYTERIIDDVRVARETGNYAMEFLERGLDQNQKTGEDLKGKELDEAYLKYLLEEEEKLMHK